MKVMLIIDEKIIKLDELADKLASQFTELAVVEAFRSKQNAFEADDALQNKIKILEENLAYIRYRPEIKALQKELLMSDVIYELKVAENDVQKSLSDLAKKIAEVISADIPVDEHLPLKKGGHHGKHHTCG